MTYGDNALFVSRRRRLSSNRLRNASMMSSAPCRLFASLLFGSCLANAFNVDTKAPIVKEGSADSYFGFSLAQHYVQDHLSGEVSPVILVGAPRDNITDQEAPDEVRRLVRPGAVYKCPFTSNTDDCDDIRVDREAPSDSEDKNDQWLGVSVASQGTDDGKAMVCAHRYKLASSYYRWGIGQCVSLSNALDEDQYYQPCDGKPRNAGHGEYGYCQAGISATISKNGDLLIGAPGPYNWRGVLFKNQLIEALDGETEWIASPVEDPTPANPGPDPATSYYSYLGMLLISAYFSTTLVILMMQTFDRQLAGAVRSC